MNRNTRLIESYANMAELMNEDVTSAPVYGDASDGSNGISNGDNYATGDNRIPKAGKKVQKRNNSEPCSCDGDCDCGDTCSCDGLCTCKKTKETIGSPL